MLYFYMKLQAILLLEELHATVFVSFSKCGKITDNIRRLAAACSVFLPWQYTRDCTVAFQPWH